MKKKKLLLTCALIIGLLIISCTEDETTNGSPELSNLNLNLEDSNLGKELVLLQYNSVSDIQFNLEKKIELVLNNIRTEITESKGSITDIHIQLNINTGKITIAEFSKFNTGDNSIVEQVVYDQQSNSYNRLPTGILPDFAKCPDGFTLIDSCSNVGNTSECVAQAISGFLTEAVSTIGDCAQVQIEVGTFTTKVCGKNC